MKASPDDQLKLLDLQLLDSALDRLAHRRRTLPEIEQAEQLAASVATLEDRIVMAQTEDSDLGREQAKLETDIEVVRGRMTRDQQRLDAGHVSPRELESLQSEVESLHRRQTTLEDSELELMEQREQIGTFVADLIRQRDEAAVSLSDTDARRDAALTAIESDQATSGADRTQLAGSLPSELVALYEKIRGSSAGVGAAALHRGRCEGCHLALNTIELAQIRDSPDDDVVRCDECRRILVRTAESGL